MCWNLNFVYAKYPEFINYDDDDDEDDDFIGDIVMTITK